MTVESSLIVIFVDIDRDCRVCYNCHYCFSRFPVVQKPSVSKDPAFLFSVAILSHILPSCAQISLKSDFWTGIHFF
jgi:hypothetical protein